ncbi:MAG: serine/threonine-protein kinase, partial [Actinomycetota bacterium]
MGIPVVAGYEDVEAVAAGGHGTVFRARQTRLDRTVALKAVTIDATDDGARASMLRESRIMAAVSQHPNIVTIHDTVFAADGSLCLVMDWYQRGSLADEIAANGPLPVERVLDHGIKLAAALHAAHDRGIVHRDLKPGNILLSDYGEPAITDFGTASYRSDRTDPDGLRAVTLHYAAPELLDDGPVTPAADVYALAATLYHAVSGRRPFASGAAPSLEELVGRVVAGEPAALGDDTPAPLRTVIVADLAKDPARRHPTARALAEALQGVQSELGIAATPIVSPSAVAALAGLANDDPTDGSDVPFTAASAEGAGARTGVPPGRRPSWPQRQMSWATERYGPWPAIGVTLLVVLAVAAILPWRPTGRGPFLASERQATTDAPADIAVGEPGPDDVDLAAVFDRPLSDDEPDGADDALDSASQIGGTESPAGSGSEATGPSTADAASGAASLEPAGDNGPSSTSPPPTPTTERPTTITDAAPGTEPTSPAPSTSSVVGVDCSVWYTPARGEQVSPYAAVTSVDAAVRRAPDGA